MMIEFLKGTFILSLFKETQEKRGFCGFRKTKIQFLHENCGFLYLTSLFSVHDGNEALQRWTPSMVGLHHQPVVPDPPGLRHEEGQDGPALVMGRVGEDPLRCWNPLL